MASLIKKCEICGKTFNYTSGHFTQHLLKEHKITLKEYVIETEYGGISPKCACGYCNEEPHFFRGKFNKWVNEHKTYEWRNKQYIKKYGIPKCKGCGKDIGFTRDTPLSYCSFECLPNNWNQDKIKETVKEKYNVSNVSHLEEVKKIISVKNKKSAKKSLEKRRDTVMKKYGVDSTSKLELTKERHKQTMLDKYGVENYAQTGKFREDSRKRMIMNNPMKNLEVVKKMSATYINNLEKGKYKLYKIQKYKNTDLYYQSSYEKEFLELCESLNILNKVKNGNSYLLEDNVHQTLTDFSIGDYEIEIKSSWILKKQGGVKKMNEKRKAVEAVGKRYIFILDKDYSEFEEIFNNTKAR